MKQPLCVKCRKTMSCHHTGINVIEIARSVGPYAIFSGDLFACTGCGYEVVPQYADLPIAMHHHTNFEATLHDVIYGNIRFLVSVERGAEIPENLKEAVEIMERAVQSATSGV